MVRVDSYSGVLYESCLVADLYIVLYESIISDPKTGHGREGLYFGENDEYTMVQLAKAISEALVDLNLGTSGEPKPFTPEENTTFFGVRISIIRAKSFG